MQSRAEGENCSTVSVVFLNMAGMFQDLLRSAFGRAHDVQVAACAADQGELAAVLEDCSPEVALIGVQGLARDTSAIPFLQYLASAAPAVRSIVIAPEIDREDVVSLFHHGARGLICASGADMPLLTRCIQCVASGQIWASAAQLELLVRSLSVPRPFKVTNVLGDALLSKREEQVLHLLADGLSNRELAGALNLSEHTVKNHLFRIFDKLGVSNRMEAVLYLISQREQRSLASPARRPPQPQTRPEMDSVRDIARVQ